jgi:hypothetical protein
MGIYSDWVMRNPDISDKIVATIEFVLKMLDKTACPFPVGAQYTQYSSVASTDLGTAFPQIESPNSLWPDTQWSLLWNTESIFFRTEGEQADNQRSSGVQEDRIRNITGSIHAQIRNDGGVGNYNPSGAFSQQTGSYASMFNSSGTSVPSDKILNFSAANSIGNSHVGTDIAPRNRLMRIWKRIL